jgi:NADH:ubiquinone oxidoreductase subunit F (NADH-binding)
MPQFTPVLLEAVGIANGHTLASYRARGGYAPLEQILRGKQPVDVVEMVKA